MRRITIELREVHIQNLLTLALEAKLPPEDLLRTRVEEWLDGPSQDFLQAAQSVLKKNEELYRRLA